MGCGSSQHTKSTTYDSNFSMGPVIGRGGFATIKKTVYVPDNTEFASKIINIRHCLSRTGGASILRGELMALKLSSFHPFISNLHFAFHDTTHCYLVLDLLEGGDLRYHIAARVHFSEKKVAFIAACISSALHHIHRRGVIHRDVKPENIVLDIQGYPRLTDFGVSHCGSSTERSAGGMVCTLSSGTLRYLAPEVLTHSHRHSIESDFWSLGVVMYELLYLDRVFDKHCPKEFVRFVDAVYSDLWTEEKYDDQIASHTTKSSDCMSTESDIALAALARSSSTKNLPASLRVDVPPSTPFGFPVTDEFASIMHGLLEVRIPQRLGSGEHNYKALKEHPFFERMGVSWDSVVRREVSSPLGIDTLAARDNTLFVHAQKSRADECGDVSEKFNVNDLPPIVQETLQQYSYKSSQYTLCPGKSKRFTDRSISRTFTSVAAEEFLQA